MGSDMTENDTLSGRTILVLEDEPLIAMDVELALLDAGAQVLGPVGDERNAMAAIDAATRGGGTMGGAVLDVHLGQETCENVAARLLGLKVPFVFHTGNLRDRDGFVARSGAPIVRKPALTHELLTMLRGIV